MGQKIIVKIWERESARGDAREGGGGKADADFPSL